MQCSPEAVDAIGEMKELRRERWCLSENSAVLASPALVDHYVYYDLPNSDGEVSDNDL